MARRKQRILQVLAITALAVSGFIAAGALAVTGNAEDSTITTTTTTTTTPGGEGCTPGFWKQPQHFDSWPVSTTTTLAAAGFTNTGLPAGTTLLEALSFQGGPTVQDAKNILLRQAAAAYLNSFDIDYPLTTQEVLDLVNDALASDDRATILAVAATLDANNNLGCPLS
jgi:hypothetical protein